MVVRQKHIEKKHEVSGFSAGLEIRLHNRDASEAAWCYLILYPLIRSYPLRDVECT